MATGDGVYARTGIEFKFEDGTSMGLCVRVFEDVPEDINAKGLQFLITFTTPTP